MSINKTILDDFDKYLIFSVSLILRVVINFVTGSQHWRRLLILKCVINNEDKWCRCFMQRFGCWSEQHTYQSPLLSTVPSFYVWSLMGHISTPPCDIKREHRFPTSSVYNNESKSLLTLKCMIILFNVDNAREVCNGW